MTGFLFVVPLCASAALVDLGVISRYRPSGSRCKQVWRMRRLLPNTAFLRKRCRAQGIKDEFTLGDKKVSLSRACFTNCKLKIFNRFTPNALLSTLKYGCFYRFSDIWADVTLSMAASIDFGIFEQMWHSSGSYVHVVETVLFRSLVMYHNIEETVHIQ